MKELQEAITRTEISIAQLRGFAKARRNDGQLDDIRGCSKVVEKNFEVLVDCISDRIKNRSFW